MISATSIIITCYYNSNKWNV